MAKRQKINYDGEELSRNLKQSTGKGVDAFFPDQSPAPIQPTAELAESPQQGVGTDTHARIGARTPTQTDTSEDITVDEHVHARTGAQTVSSTDTSVNQIEEVQIAAIQKMVRAKRHLSSFTFRFRANELDELDQAVNELNQDDEHKISKNDAVRTALNWLLADYKARKQESVLARVLTDT